MDYSSIPVIVALWQHDRFRGRRVAVARDTPNLKAYGMNDTVTAVGVHPGPSYQGDSWLVTIYEHDGYRGKSVNLGVGEHADLTKLGMNDNVTSVKVWNAGKADVHFTAGRQPIGRIAPIPVVAELFEQPGFRGRSMLVFEPVADLGSYADFNDRVRSIRVMRGPDFDERTPGLWFFREAGFGGMRGSLVVGEYPELPRNLPQGISSVHFREGGKADPP